MKKDKVFIDIKSIIFKKINPQKEQEQEKKETDTLSNSDSDCPHSEEAFVLIDNISKDIYSLYSFKIVDITGYREIIRKIIKEIRKNENRNKKIKHKKPEKDGENNQKRDA